tara:strand:- start:37981 stop:38223 length:243 start_codon:yes stop_codon:yes gene_type:complete
MKQAWTKGLEGDASKEMRSHFLSASVMRKRMIKMLMDKELEASKAGRSKAGYDCPNWAFKQADMSGYIRALHDVISYLED